MIYQRLRDELTHLRAKLECSQRVADQAIKERDDWHRRWDHAQDQLDDQILPRYRATMTPHLHDGTRADKAIRPRGATGRLPLPLVRPGGGEG